MSIIFNSPLTGFCIQGEVGLRFCGFSCDFLFGLLLLAVVAATLIQNPIRGELEVIDTITFPVSESVVFALLEREE